MEKRIAMFIATFIFGLTFMCMAAVAAEQKDKTAEKKECEAFVAGITGKAQYKEKEEDEWVDAELNMCVYVGDIVRTMKDSGLALQFGKKTTMKVNALSQFVISTMDPKKPAPNQVNFKVGESYAKIDDKDTKTVFTVKTPTAVCGVRGTKFDVVVDEDGKSKVSVLEGVVSVFNELGEVLAEAGMSTEILKGKMPGDLMKFDVAEFQNKLNAWKDQISIGKVKEAMKQQVEEKKEEIKEKAKGIFKF